jgi:hypothetical protein
LGGWLTPMFRNPLQIKTLNFQYQICALWVEIRYRICSHEIHMTFASDIFLQHFLLVYNSSMLRQKSSYRIRHNANRTGVRDHIDWSSRKIIDWQKSMVSRIREDLEGDHITSISQIRFEQILCCLPENQKRRFQITDGESTCQDDLFRNMTSLVNYCSEKPLHIHRPAEGPDGMRCPYKACGIHLKSYVNLFSCYAC